MLKYVLCRWYRMAWAYWWRVLLVGQLEIKKTKAAKVWLRSLSSTCWLVFPVNTVLPSVNNGYFSCVMLNEAKNALSFSKLRLTSVLTKLSLGDQSFQIKSSMIWIPSCTNLNVEFGPIQNLMAKSYCIKSYRSIFD